MSQHKAACPDCGAFDWELQDNTGIVETHTFAHEAHEILSSYAKPSKYNFRCKCGKQASGRTFGTTVQPKWMAELIEAMYEDDDKVDGFHKVHKE